MNITKIISKVFDSRLKAIDLYDTQAGEIQHRVLTRLVKQAENTEWGKKYDYKSITKTLKIASPYKPTKKLNLM
jgi:hypothetical protein